MEQNETRNPDRPDDQTSLGNSRQGNDKAPGEEPAQNFENTVADTQKGKNKVDGDPSLESDKPKDQDK